MTNGLYGYYDTKNEYVVYIGKDGSIGNDARHKTHTIPSQYDKQVINRVIQKNPDRYTYFRFIEGEYNDETLNELEKEAIRLFKTYKYDYPEKDVFNFTRGGDDTLKGQDHPNWRKDDYKVIKRGMYREKQRYAIVGRCDKSIKYSTNKEVLKKLTNKLNNKKITEEEVKNLQLYSTKKQTKNAIQACIKYNIWDVSYCEYHKSEMFRNNYEGKPCKCFRYKYKGNRIPIGGFHDFITCQIINLIVEEEVKKCKHEN